MKNTYECQLSKYNLKISNLSEEQSSKIDFKNLLDNLIQWSSGCSNLSKTSIINPQLLTNERNIYLLDIKSHTDFYAIILWIGIAERNLGKSTVFSIDITQSLGIVNAQSKDFDNNHVPGEPKVFIIKKNDYNHLYTFTWENHRNNKISALASYLTIFLNDHSQYQNLFAKKSEEENNTILVENTVTALSDFVNKVSFKLVKKEVDRECIKDNLQNINKIIRTSSCKAESNLDIAAWQTMLKFFSKKIKLKNQTESIQTKKTISTIKYTPNETELKRLFEIYDQKEFGIENIRFEFNSASGISPISLARGFEIESYSIPLEFYTDTNIPDLEKLLKSVEVIL